VAFVLARRWTDGRAEIFLRTTAPRGVELSYLIRTDPGRGAEVRTAVQRLPRGGGGFFRRRLDAVDWLPLGAGLASGNAATVGGEVAVPLLVPQNFSHELLGEEVVEGEPCTLVRSRAAQPNRWFTHAVLWLSKRTNVALRTVYFRGEDELRRVSVAPSDVMNYEGGFMPRSRRIETADGKVAVAVLRDLTFGPPLPDRIFSERYLSHGRMPPF
jgi:hypothetical protein